MATNAADPPAATTKFYSRDEVSKHKDTSNELWFIIHNSVYNVTGFLKEHPGGEEVLYEHAGQDATEAFEDVGHSSDARQMMEPYKIGELLMEERNESSKNSNQKRDGGSNSCNDDGSSGSWRSWLIPVAVGVLATLIYRYFIAAR